MCSLVGLIRRHLRNTYIVYSAAEYGSDLAGESGKVRKPAASVAVSAAAPSSHHVLGIFLAAGSEGVSIRPPFYTLAHEWLVIIEHITVDRNWLRVTSQV